ncbi:MAG TPA: hypothetical protein VMV19_17585 [Xanthobacteraceae bacterium]|nr:hypothetical protein [Xanthobacteraceae bacterium]
MSYAADDGFAALMTRFDPEFMWATAHQYRQRDQVMLLTRIAAALGVTFK